MTASAAPPPILDVIAETTDLARQLLNVLRREAEALTAMKLKAPGGFTEAKTRLISAYAYKLEELRDTPMVPAAEPALADLRVLNDEVMAAATHNAAVEIRFIRSLLESAANTLIRRNDPTLDG